LHHFNEGGVVVVLPVYQEFIAFIMNQLHLEAQRLEYKRQQGADEAAKLKEDVVSHDHDTLHKGGGGNGHMVNPASVPLIPYPQRYL